jgi:hypothetical protein
MHKNHIQTGTDALILSSSPIHRGEQGKVKQVYWQENKVRLEVPGHGDQIVIGLKSIMLWIDGQWEPVQGVL